MPHWPVLLVPMFLPHTPQTWKTMRSLILPSLPRSSVTLSTRRLVLKHSKLAHTQLSYKNLHLTHPPPPCYHSSFFIPPIIEKKKMKNNRSKIIIRVFPLNLLWNQCFPSQSLRSIWQPFCLKSWLFPSTFLFAPKCITNRVEFDFFQLKSYYGYTLTSLENGVSIA